MLFRSAVIADRLSRCLDPAVERRWCDIPMSPDSVEQLLLRYGPVATRKQVREDVEHLRLNSHTLATTAKLMKPSVKLVVAEGKDQTIGSRYRHEALPGQPSKWRRCMRSVEPEALERITQEKPRGRSSLRIAGLDV